MAENPEILIPCWLGIRDHFSVSFMDYYYYYFYLGNVVGFLARSLLKHSFVLQVSVLGAHVYGVTMARILNQLRKNYGKCCEAGGIQIWEKSYRHSEQNGNLQLLHASH